MSEDKFEVGETWISSTNFEWVVVKVDPTIYNPYDIGRPGLAWLRCERLGEEWPYSLWETINWKLKTDDVEHPEEWTALQAFRYIIRERG